MAIAVIQKSFAVLEALSAAERSLPLQELTAPLNMPKPTVYRILQTLVQLGYVGQEERTGFYFLTSRLANLGHPNPYRAVVRRARPLLEALHAQFNETVNVGVLEGTQVRYVDLLETTQALRHVASPRSTDLFFSTALGRAIAAFLPADESAQLLARVELQAYTPNTITSRTALQAELTATRKRGWSQEDGENDIDLVCFGAPVLDPDGGRPLAGISVSLPRYRLTAALRKTITQALAAITAAAAATAATAGNRRPDRAVKRKTTPAGAAQ